MTRLLAVVAAAAVVGSAAPLEGTSGHLRTLADFRGRAVVVVYEDRDSAHQNDALKDELAARAQDPRSANVALVAVADLRAYDFWPARGFARDAVANAARRFRTELFIDWTGALGRDLGLPRRQSGVLVLDRGGAEVYRHVGTLDAADRAAFFASLAKAAAP